MCIRDSIITVVEAANRNLEFVILIGTAEAGNPFLKRRKRPVSYTHLRAHETVLDLVCRLLLEKKKNPNVNIDYRDINTP